jgi:prolyl 4-hydroxylase
MSIIIAIIFLICLIGIGVYFFHKKNSNTKSNTSQSTIPKPNLVTEKEYKQYNNFPFFTEKGYKVIKLPPDLRARLSKMWKENRKHRTHENIDKMTANYVKNPKNKTETYMVNLDEGIKKETTDFILQELVKWTGIMNLKKTALYGVREYTDGAVLEKHVDRYDTHILSAIINIGQINMKEPWALSVENRTSSPRDIIFENGFDVVLYESASLVHGRTKPLQGEAFANLFIHFAPDDWDEQLKNLDVQFE